MTSRTVVWTLAILAIILVVLPLLAMLSMRAWGSGFMNARGSTAPGGTMGSAAWRLVASTRKKRMIAVWKIVMPMTFFMRLRCAIIV